MEKYNRQTMRRWLSVFLAVMLILPQTPVTAEAENGNQRGMGICAHHTKHTEEFGYQEAHRCSHSVQCHPI